MKKYDRIRNLREDKDLTQQQLADYLFVTQRTYSRYENGEHAIPIEVLIEISNYHSVSVDYLLGLTDNPERNL
ncbi:MAG: helix-turn-helix domain-containing protein [Lachnospiraceae bacterium]|nr:helix-turn-helix domain-containing protein [Lachnospiraceae bacterium]